MNLTPTLIAAYSIVDRLGNRAHYAATISLDTRRVTKYVQNGYPATSSYIECDRWQAEALEQIAVFSGVVLPPLAPDRVFCEAFLDLPDFDEEPGVGNEEGQKLHKAMTRAGIRGHYGFAARVLGLDETPSLAALTIDEANAVWDAIRDTYTAENAVIEQSRPSATLTNPEFRQGFRISLDPNQSGVSARGRQGLGA